MPGEFPHLILAEVRHGPARLHGGGEKNDQAELNKKNRKQHAANLLQGIGQIAGHAQKVSVERAAQGLPPIPGGTPFLVKVTDGQMLEFLAEKLGLEVVAEYEDGFVVVAATDLDFKLLKDMVASFTQEEWGSTQTANLLTVYDDASRDRLEKVLAPTLLAQWPFADDAILVLDVSVQTAGLAESLGTRPTEPRKNESPEAFGARVMEWEAERDRILVKWEDTRIEREEGLDTLVKFYGGTFLSSFVDAAGGENTVVDFPDSFSARIQMSGRGFKDLIQNFPNLFEVTESDELRIPAAEAAKAKEDEDFTLIAPSANAPAVCVIDSGIQEGHRLLQPAIDAGHSRSFLPGVSATDVADYFGPAGHGTRVAGAVIYPREIPVTGTAEAPCWVQNARLLDNGGHIPAALYPPAALRQIVAHFRGTARRTRIYNHSVASNGPCRVRRMSTWAAEMDWLSYQHDVLFIQAAGNISGSSTVPGTPGVRQHLAEGRDYPAYLREPSSRISNPAQSLQALTVGSIAAEAFATGDRRSIAAALEPSAFSRSGFGMWNSIKPEVVEFGGDYVRDGATPPLLTRPPEVCPDLVRSTLIEAGPAHARDDVGTSYAAPKIAHLAARLAALYPEHSSLLYRALIVQSARWPAWAESAPSSQRLEILQTMGYGVPDITRATENNDFRVTLITNGVFELGPGDAAIFEVPIPAEINRPGLERTIRVDVTLSYAAQPRRTRRARTGYLGTWLDWIASRRNESAEDFRARAFTGAGDPSDEDNQSIPWQLERLPHHGVIRGVSRNGGTIQRDWAFLKSYELPSTLCIAVRGHTGWASDTIDSKAKFVVAVGFEAVDGDLPIYVPVQMEIEARIRERSALRTS